MNDMTWSQGGHPSLAAFHRDARPETLMAIDHLDDLEVIACRQQAGSYPDPAGAFFSLQLATFADAPSRFDFGPGRFRTHLRTGCMALGAAGAACEHDIDGPHEIMVITLPSAFVIENLRDLDAGFGTDFGQLHTADWHDRTLWDRAWRVRRAALPDACDPDLDGDTATLMLAERLLELSRGRPLEAPRDYALAPSVRRRIVDYVEETLDGDLGLSALARVADLSPYHFARAFRAEKGFAPARYVLHRRVSHAFWLVRETDMRMVDIAAMCGFSSQPRMNEAFRRLLGYSPGALRRGEHLN